MATTVIKTWLTNNENTKISPCTTSDIVFHGEESVSDKLDSIDTSLEGKADSSSLATVATSGSYNDLKDKPEIGGGSVTSVAVKMNGSEVTGSPITTSGTIDLGTVITAHQDISGKADKSTTLSGYGITDAKIESGVITLGENTITPVTDISDKQDKLTAGDNISIEGTTISATDTKYSEATTSVAGLMSSADKTKLDGVAEGATANTGTVTSVGIKMNGEDKGSVTTNGTIDLGTVITSHQDISGKADKATTLAGYGITDAKISDGVITLGENTITPLTSHQDISGKQDKLTAGDNITIDGTTISADGAIVGTKAEIEAKIAAGEIGEGDKVVITDDENDYIVYQVTVDGALSSTSENPVQNKVITAALNNYALVTEAGYSLGLSIDTSTYVMTLQLKNKAGTVLDSKTIDFPIESMVVNASYADGKLTLTLQNGQTLTVDISDIVSGLVKTSDIVNNLTSTDTDKPLSAYQGKVLQDEIGRTSTNADYTATVIATGGFYSLETLSDGTNTINVYGCSKNVAESVLGKTFYISGGGDSQKGYYERGYYRIIKADSASSCYFYMTSYKDSACTTVIVDNEKYCKYISNTYAKHTGVYGEIEDLDAKKVDSEIGKGLSSNDYTLTEKTKLAGIATGATAVTSSTVSGWGFATTSAVDSKVNTSDIVDNVTSTDTDKPLSANQGKVLQDEIGAKDTSYYGLCTNVSYTRMSDYMPYFSFTSIDGTYTNKGSFSADQMEELVGKIIYLDKTYSFYIEGHLCYIRPGYYKILKGFSTSSYCLPITAYASSDFSEVAYNYESYTEFIATDYSSIGGLVGELNKKVNITDIQDNLTTTNIDKPLSANMGKTLKSEIGSTGYWAIGTSVAPYSPYGISLESIDGTFNGTFLPKATFEKIKNQYIYVPTVLSYNSKYVKPGYYKILNYTTMSGYSGCLIPITIYSDEACTTVASDQESYCQYISATAPTSPTGLHKDILDLQNSVVIGTNEEIQAKITAGTLVDGAVVVITDVI